MQGIVLGAGNTLVNKAPALIELTFPKRKTDNEMSKIHGQDNQVVISAMKKAEQGDGIVQGGSCGWVDRESFSKEVTFQLRPEYSALAKESSAVKHFKQGKQQEQSQASSETEMV